jgi:hypothetical protein
MHSKVNDNLRLSADGREVAVSGPITEWDDDEQSATFTVVIAQIDENGDIVLARGRSRETYRNGAKKWEATAKVIQNDARLTAGEARAWALASITETSGNYELYPWSVETHLVSDVVVVAAAR